MYNEKCVYYHNIQLVRLYRDHFPCNYSFFLNFVQRYTYLYLS